MKPRQRFRLLNQRLRRRRTVLVAASSPMNLVVMRPVLDVLLADPRLDVVFTGRHHGMDDVRPLLARAGLPDLQVCRERVAKRLPADLYLCADGTRFGKRCLTRVLMFHGVSFKGRSLGRRVRWFQRVLLVGPYQRRVLAERVLHAADEGRLVDVGMPKLDRLARGAVDVAAVRARIGAAEDERVVLYAPTWGRQSALETHGEALVQALAEHPRCRVLVKLHDHTFDPTRTDVDWRARVQSWRWPNVARWDEVDVVPALAAADVLVTDFSSVAQEFCLLDRPILFADVPQLFQSARYRDTVDLATWGRRMGTVFSGPNDAGAALADALAHPGRLAAVRRAVAQDVFSHPGQATPRALAEVYAALRLPVFATTESSP